MAATKRGRHHQVDLSDSSSLEDNPGGADSVERKTYEVVKPLFKRGELHEPGHPIELDVDTANRFLETGDIKEMKK